MTRFAWLSSVALLLAACSNNSGPASEFTVAVSPSTQSITLPAGTSGTANYTVTTTETMGTAETITLSVAGLPAGVTGGFNPATVNGDGTSVLTLTASSSAAAGNTSFTITATADSGVHTATASVGICIPGQATLTVTQTDAYTCHQPYLAQFVVNNGTCAPITVSEVILTGSTTSPNCTPAGTSNYPLNPVVTIGASTSATALNLTGGHFCCNSSPCPATFMCEESFSFQVVTSAGTLTAPAQDASIDLSGCTGEVCP